MARGESTHNEGHDSPDQGVVAEPAAAAGPRGTFDSHSHEGQAPHDSGHRAPSAGIFGSAVSGGSPTSGPSAAARTPGKPGTTAATSWLSVAWLGLVVVAPLALLCAMGALLSVLVSDAHSSDARWVVLLLWAFVIVLAGVIVSRFRPALAKRYQHRTTTRVILPSIIDRRDHAIGAAVGAAGVLAVAPPWMWGKLSTRWLGALDAPGSGWLGWAWGEQWAQHGLSRTITLGLHPAGVDMALIDGPIPHGVVAVLSRMMSAVAAYNVALLIGIALTGWAAYLLGRTVVDHRAMAAVAAVVWTISPVVAGSARVHLTFTWAFAVPLLLREGVKGARRGTINALPVMGLLLLAFGCSVYHAVFGAIGAAVISLAGPLGHRSSDAMSRWLRGWALAVAGALLVLSPILVARFNYVRHETAAGSHASAERRSDAQHLSADALEAITPARDELLNQPRPFEPTDRAFFALQPAAWGWGLVAMAAAAAVLVATRTYLARRERILALMAGVGAALLWILSLGPVLHVANRIVGKDHSGTPIEWLPFAIFSRTGVLTALRAPYRAGIALTAVTIVAVLAASSTKWSTMSRNSRLGVGGVLLVLAVLGTVRPVTTSAAVDPGLRKAFAVIAKDKGNGVVMSVPFRCEEPGATARQILYRHRTLGCSVGTSATPWYSGLSVWFDSPALLSTVCRKTPIGPRTLNTGSEVVPFDAISLKELHDEFAVRYLIIDRAALADPRCSSVRPLAGNLAAIASIGGDATTTVVDLTKYR